MKKLLFVIILVILSSCGKKVAEADYNSVIPLPQNIAIVEGKGFLLDAHVVICHNDDNEGIRNTTKFLNQFVKEKLGYELKYQNLKNTGTEKKINLKIDTNITTEGYKITISEHAITIEGGSAAGLFYGVQTIRKSIPVSENNTSALLPAVMIEDYPRFAYRGMMLDVSRHFSTVDFIKRYIDILALHNINKFHMHLTEDQGWRIEIKRYPRLTEVGSQRKETIKGFMIGEYDATPHGGFYTQEELKDIVQYAQERYIDVIPEVDLPGHMLAALASYPELGCTGGPYEVATKWGIHSDVLCAGNEKTYEFLENVFAEIFDIFPSEYIHIGGDECPKIRWKACAKCQTKIKQLGLKDDAKYSKESKLQSYLTHRLEKFISAKGRKLIGWDEIIEGGLAPNATVMSWRGEDGGRYAAQTGHDVVMCPNSHLYFDYYQTENTATEPEGYPDINSLEEVYNFNPIPSGLTEEETKRVIGVQANLWVEQISKGSHVEYMILPRLAALAELQWVNEARKDYSKFLDRLQNFVSNYDLYQYNFAVAAFEPKAKFVKEGNTLKLLLSTYDNADIRYTLDGKEPTSKSEKYIDPILLKDKGQIQARAFRKNKLIDNNLYIQNYDMNKATLRKAELLTPISKYFDPPAGASILTDGRRGNGCHVFGRTITWIGFGNKMEVVIDLAEMQKIQSVTTSVILVPNTKGAKYSISVSEDGMNYKESYSDHLSFEAQTDLRASLKDVKTRYVKILIESDNYAHVLADEIIIE